MDEGIDEVVLSEEAIRSRVNQLADQLYLEYRDIVTEKAPLVLVCVLKGSFIFCSDLFRSIGARLSTTIEFVQFARGGQTPETRGQGAEVTLLTDLKQDVHGKHVLVIEDIIDTSATLEYLQFILAARSPKSMDTCVLIDKRPPTSEAAGAKYTGFTLAGEKRFLVGYGMDCREHFRSLPYIGALNDALFRNDGCGRPGEEDIDPDCMDSTSNNPFEADF